MKTKRLVVTQGVDETGEPEEFTWDLFPVVESTDTAHLDEDGLPKDGTRIRERMIIVGKWGKSKSFNQSQLPNALELHGFPRPELVSKFGHFWRNTSFYADASTTGFVTKAFLETVGNEVRAVVELDQPD